MDVGERPEHGRFVEIDGSAGEGGGQILRTSLALSCSLGKPFVITNIRASRRNPGLQPQHLTAVKAAAMISRADVEGAELGSRMVVFHPNDAAAGPFSFDVAERKGSAGSASLVIQTILLPLSLRVRPSSVTVEGGTHVPASPSYHYLERVYAPLLRRIGAQTSFTLAAWGWYPRGGGSLSAEIAPARERPPLVLMDRGPLLRVRGLSAVSNLPDHIAKRQRDRALTVLAHQGIDAQIELLSAPSPGKGSCLFLAAEFEHAAAGFGGLGAIGKRAEEVADEACTALLLHGHARGALDPHLADQIVPWLGFCRGQSGFTTSRVTRHLLTNLGVVRQFMNVEVRVQGSEGEEGRVMIAPAGGGAGVPDSSGAQ